MVLYKRLNQKFISVKSCTILCFMLNFLDIMEDTTDTILEAMDILVIAEDMVITTATTMDMDMEVIVERETLIPIGHMEDIMDTMDTATVTGDTTMDTMDITTVDTTVVDVHMDIIIK